MSDTELEEKEEKSSIGDKVGVVLFIGVVVILIVMVIYTAVIGSVAWIRGVDAEIERVVVQHLESDKGDLTPGEYNHIKDKLLPCVNAKIGGVRSMHYLPMPVIFKPFDDAELSKGAKKVMKECFNDYLSSSPTVADRPHRDRIVR